MNILERRECKELAAANRWLLVYGRRKVGKTRTLEALVGDEVWGVEEAVREAVRTLRRGGVVVLDEFQRLPERWWDLLASAHPNGVLIASGSSFGMLRRVFDKRSPLLGLFDVLKMGPIRYADALAQTRDFKRAAVWRDPWTVPLVGSPEEVEERVF
ncbi:MAG: ATP-binding protein, partial [Thermoproteus sp.]